MPNQITFAATITPPTAPMEVTINSGTTWAALVFATVGSNQRGTLTGVAAGTYAINAVGLRAVGYPSTVLYNFAASISVSNPAAAATATYQDLYIGDSLTTSYPQSNVLDANSYPTFAHAALDVNIWKMNGALGQGYPSQTAEQIQANGLAYVSGLKLATVLKTFVVVRAGINNLRLGQTVDATFLALTNLCTALFNAGLFPLVCTTTINRYAGDPNQDALQADLNNRIKTQQTTLKASGVIDLGSDYRLSASTTTYQSDGIHETIAGRQVVAAMAAQGVQQAATGATGFIVAGQSATATTVSPATFTAA